MRRSAVTIGIVVGILTAIVLPWWNGFNTLVAWVAGLLAYGVAQHLIGNGTHSVSDR